MGSKLGESHLFLLMVLTYSAVWASTRATVSKDKKTLSRVALTEGNEIDIGTTVYATMQPRPGLGFPSASIGVERMGSDSEELDVMVKSVAKESIVVVGVL